MFWPYYNYYIICQKNHSLTSKMWIAVVTNKQSVNFYYLFFDENWVNILNKTPELICPNWTNIHEMFQGISLFS